MSFVLIDSFVISPPVVWLSFHTCHTYVFQQHKDNDRVSVKKLSNCQVSEMPLLKAVDKKKLWFFF